MDGARHAVVELVIGLRDGVLLVARSVLDVSQGCCLHNVLDLEALDGLVLGGASTASVASCAPLLSSIFLGSSVVTPLFGHLVVWFRCKDGL